MKLPFIDITTSEEWGISERKIQKLCEENRIEAIERFGRT